MTSALIGNIAWTLGSIFILVAFAYQTARNAAPDVLSSLLNLIGATLLAVSLTITFNLPVLLLELSWAVIALFGLVRALRTRT
jgi:glucose uptake protein GlcU